MAVPVAIFLAANAGRPSAHGWGAAMSTDTAFALGVLALVAPSGTRLRVRLLTLAVVDDFVALLVIATAYTSHVELLPLAIAAGLLVVLFGLRRAPPMWRTRASSVVGVATWVALRDSGIDPVITGLAVGLVTSAYQPARADLEQVVELTRSFREQPRPESARAAARGVASAISPNERLQYALHPWTSYAIVPLFALANAGIHLTGGLLGAAIGSPITLGILVGYVVGKPVGIFLVTWLGTRLTARRLRPPVGWASVAASGTVAGIGFTVSLLIATLAFHGRALEEAKLGVLSAALVASGLTWLVFRTASLLPPPMRTRVLLGSTEAIVDLAAPVDPARDHVRGPETALVTLVEYGDFECPYCGQAEPVVRELLADFGDLEYVWRHLPLNDVHPNTQLAAEASEAAAAQGAFWEMHDLLFRHQDALQPPDLLRYAEELGLDTERFADELRKHTHAGRVAEDVDSADLSGVSGTPTFFVNGRRHYGAYDVATLSAAVRAAKARALIATPAPA
jgi:Na+/H+ antiporter NhaA/protein-disulfide isomerase